MPYKFKGARDCTQSSGKKGKYLTIKKDGTRKCYKSEDNYKSSMAWGHGPIKSGDEKDKTMIMTEAQLREVIRETLIQEGIFSKIGNWLKDKMGLGNLPKEMQNKVADKMKESGPMMQKGIKIYYESLLSTGKWMEENGGFGDMKPKVSSAKEYAITGTVQWIKAEIERVESGDYD